jgi:PAS domain S-box-containing protein
MQPEPKVNILLVDDREENLLALEAILLDLGQNLVKAHSGSQALRCLLQDTFAVILLDVEMPGMDGLETAARIRAREPFEPTPIIFLTAIHESDAYVFKGYSLGAVDYIFKPIKPEILKAKVQVFIDLFKKRAKVKHHAEEITKLNQDLERRVLERTGELAATNAELKKEITGRKRVEEALREQREWLRVTLSSVGDAVIATDREGKVTFMNPVSESLTGWQQEEAYGKSLEDVFHIVKEHTRQPVDNPVTKVLREGRVIGLANHTVLIAKNGTEIPIDDSGAPIKDDEGNILGVVLIFRDVTERRRAEEERAQHLLREQAARAEAEAAERRAAFLAEASKVLGSSLDYEATLASVARLAVPRMADWCVVDMVEADGSLRRLAVSHVDPAKVELARELERQYPTDPNLPYGPAQVLGTGQSEIYPDIPDSLLKASAQNAEHLKILRELGFRSYMTVLLAARGVRLGVITFMTAESGRRYDPSDLALAEDVARRASIAIDNARLYNEAQEASRAKDEFLAIVSHELRTPMTPILGWARLLRAEKLDAGTAGRALETIERNAKAQSQLIEDLLDVSRIISGKLRLDLRPVELVPIIEAAIDSVRPAANAKGIQIRKALDLSVSLVSGDPNRLQQILWNLLSNAIKFTPKDGHVEVRLERTDSQAEIKVKDTGIGIHADFLPYIFDRFRQADSSTTRKHGGLGLGLALVRHLVELHGGAVHAESPGEGQGATFTVRLPIRAVRAEASHQERVPPTVGRGARLENPPRLDGLQVLVVDDEADTRALLTFVLEQCGAGVTVAASVAEALAALRRGAADVLVSDIGMPGEDGYDLIRKVRALAPEQGGHIPAVALTAYAKEEDRRRALLAGYQMHVAKPVDPAKLATVVASVVGRTAH